jgi:membrane protease YdiL (CAAX protease family)
VENNSTSTPSPAYQTPWPSNAFKFGPTASTLLGVVLIAFFVGSLSVVIIHFRHPGLDLARGQIPVADALVAQLALYLAVVGFLVAVLPLLSGLTLRDLGFRIPRLGVIGVALLGAVGMFAVATIVGGAIDRITHTTHVQDVVQMLESIHQPWLIAFFAVFAIALAPIAEEMIFRIFLFNAGLRWGGFWVGALVSSAVFGLAHFDRSTGFASVVPLAVIGLILCGVYYRSRNAYASMIAHGVFNSVTVVLILVAPNLVNR